MANKEATIYISDVSSSMANRLDQLSDALFQMLHYKVVQAKKGDHVCVLLTGSNGSFLLTVETQNPLAEDDQYQNIVALCPMSNPTLSLLKQIKNLDSYRGETSDVIDALILALYMMSDHCKQYKYQKRIYVMTDLLSQTVLNDIEVIKEQVESQGIQLFFIDYSIKDQMNNTLVRDFRELVEECKGESFASDEATQQLSELRSKKVKPTTIYRGPLTIGDTEKYPDRSLSISIWAYCKTSEFKSTSAKKWSLLADNLKNTELTHEVLMDRGYYFADDDIDSEEVKKDLVPAANRDSLIKAYRYGKTLVPFSTEDEEAFKFKTSKSMQVVGFVKMDSIKRWWSTSNTIAIVPDPNDERSIEIFSALFYNALQDSEACALVRYCRLDDSPPRLGAMLPKTMSKSPNHMYCIWIPLPFAEDYEILDLPSLKPYISKDSTSEIKRKLTNDQRLQDYHTIKSKMMKFISEMDLDKHPLSNEKGFNLKKVFQPSYQRLWDCVAYKAMNPEAKDLPDIKPEFTVGLFPDQQMALATCDLALDIAACFDLDQVQEQEFDHFTQFNSQKANILDNIVSNSPKSTSKISENVVKVGRLDPLSDFMSMVAAPGDLVEQAVNQILEIVLEFIKHPEQYQLAIDCLRAARQVCVDEDEVVQFNEWMESLEADPAFMEMLKIQNIRLITSDENINGIKS